MASMRVSIWNLNLFDVCAVYPNHIHLFFVLSCFVLGGPVPLVGVTIRMDDEALNGTNRVVLDGVLSQSECDTVMQLASVS